MEENQNTNAPRKIRKIKRVRAPENIVHTSYGMPSKVNAVTPPNAAAAPSEAPQEMYFNNNGEAESIRFITDEDRYPPQTETITYFLKNKTVVLMLILAGLVGMSIGSVFFSGSQTAKSRGLDGVVVNSDVPAGRSRCGLVEPHQGCVLYIMNPKGQEVTGKDFYETAARWTGRQRYLIETGNMHYSSKRIKPGYIAQINIPPLSS